MLSGNVITRENNNVNMGICLCMCTYPFRYLYKGVHIHFDKMMYMEPLSPKGPRTLNLEPNIYDYILSHQ